MQRIKNKYCSFAVSQLNVNVVFITQASAFLKKSHCQILVSFHFKSGTCPSFLRPLWNQRRQGQSTEGQKLGFFLLLSLRFTTVREFPTSHWCLMPYVIAGKGTVALSACSSLSLTKALRSICSISRGRSGSREEPPSCPRTLRALQSPITLSLHHPFLFGKLRLYFLFPLAICSLPLLHQLPKAGAACSGSDGSAK